MAQTVVDAVASNLRRLRQRQGWSQERLAEEMSAYGISTTRAVIAKIETFRREDFTIGEVLAAAFALDVSPVDLLLPTSGDVALLPNVDAQPTATARHILTRPTAQQPPRTLSPAGYWAATGS